MKQLFTLITILLLHAGNAFSQSVSRNVTGIIQDSETGLPIGFATVSLLDGKTLTLVKADFSDSTGTFRFENISVTEGKISISATGYEEYMTEILSFESDPEIFTGAIKLKKAVTTLQGVTVSANRKFIERKIDKTVVNVDASILNAGGSALEVLEKIPGVNVDKDGNISIKGKQGILIVVDGRPSYLKGEELTNYLRNLPASAMDQVEIMTNPPARYDASGNTGVINLKMKKSAKSGFNGNVSTAVNQSTKTSHNHSINLNYRKQKVNLFANYGYSYFKRENQQNFLRTFYSPDKSPESTFDQADKTQVYGDFQNIKLGMDFYANKKTTLGLVYSGYLNNGNRAGRNTNNMYASSGVLDSIVKSETINKHKTLNGTLNLNMRHRFDSAGTELTADLDFLRYDQDGKMSMTANYLLPDLSEKRPQSLLTGSLPSDVTVYSAKADFVKPLKKQSKFEAGIKSSYVLTDNEAIYKNRIGGVDQIDDGKTNHFRYEENINAGYINYSRQINKWGFQAGLRAEQTIAKGHQFGNSTQKDSSFTKNYVDFFPTAFVSYTMNDKNTFGMNYGRRIDRPSYQDLNPFFYFLDEYTYQVGNTLLQPQYSNNVELSHTYNGFLHSTVSYSNTNQVFTPIIRQMPGGKKLFQTSENLATATSLTISTSANIPVTKFWSADVYAAFSHQKYEGAIDKKPFLNESESFSTNLNNRFVWKKGWSAELGMIYNSREIQGQIVTYPFWRADAGIQKKLFKDKGSLKLSVRDVFNSTKFKGHIETETFRLNLNNKSYQSARLAFTYRFGNPGKKDSPRKTGGLSDVESRIK